MFQKRFLGLIACAACLVPLTLLMGGPGGNYAIPNSALFPNPSGAVQTVSRDGAIDLTGPFFQALGSNGRACATCHQPSDGMSVSADHVQARFNASLGMDPIFRTVDGSNCDRGIEVSTVAGRANAYSLLRTRGLFRVGIGAPDGADFEIAGVSNPYGCGDTAVLSLYRRPLPATNLPFLTMVMWDGRESSGPAEAAPAADWQSRLMADLARQAMDATNGHSEASTPLTAEQQRGIVAFETGLHTAQAFDFAAGMLHASGAKGGPQYLAAQEPPLAKAEEANWSPTRAAVFNLFSRWVNDAGSGFESLSDARASIVRGQDIFNSKPIEISGVAGLNGANLGGTIQPASFTGSCSTCHDVLHVGNLSVSVPMNIGLTDPATAPGASYLPVITIRSKSDPLQVAQTTDQGGH